MINAIHEVFTCLNIARELMVDLRCEKVGPVYTFVFKCVDCLEQLNGLSGFYTYNCNQRPWLISKLWPYVRLLLRLNLPYSLSCHIHIRHKRLFKKYIYTYRY